MLRILCWELRTCPPLVGKQVLYIYTTQKGFLKYFLSEQRYTFPEVKSRECARKTTASDPHPFPNQNILSSFTCFVIQTLPPTRNCWNFKSNLSSQNQSYHPTKFSPQEDSGNSPQNSAMLVFAGLVSINVSDLILNVTPSHLPLFPHCKLADFIFPHGIVHQHSCSTIQCGSFWLREPTKQSLLHYEFVGSQRRITQWFL